MTTHDRHPSPERDPVLDAAWRAHSTELPPRAVDAAILAAAHREVGSRPRTAGDDDALAEAREPSRWWWGLAAAAAIGAIAFGLVQLAPFGPAHDPTRATDMPSEERAARPASPQLAATAEAPARAKAEGAAVPAAERARDAERVPEPSQAPRAPEPGLAAKRVFTPTPAPAPATAPAPAPAPPAPPPLAEPPAFAAMPRESVSTPGVAPPQPFPMASPPAPAAPAPKQEDAAPSARERVAQAGASRAAPAAAAARAESTAPATDAARAAAGTSVEGRAALHLAPEEFVRRIREHYDAGRLDQAARELRAFRDAYADADARLPPELRAWAATLRK